MNKNILVFKPKREKQIPPPVYSKSYELGRSEARKYLNSLPYREGDINKRAEECGNFLSTVVLLTLDHPNPNKDFVCGFFEVVGRCFIASHDLED